MADLKSELQSKVVRPRMQDMSDMSLRAAAIHILELFPDSLPTEVEELKPPHIGTLGPILSIMYKEGVLKRRPVRSEHNNRTTFRYTVADKSRLPNGWDRPFMEAKSEPARQPKEQPTREWAIDIDPADVPPRNPPTPKEPQPMEHPYAGVATPTTTVPQAPPPLPRVQPAEGVPMITIVVNGRVRHFSLPDAKALYKALAEVFG